MDFNKYQKEAWKTAVYPAKEKNLYYPALGLGGEAGEILNKIKKVMRDHNGKVPDGLRQELSEEIGDLLWYCATLATELSLDFNIIAEENVSKLRSRLNRGVIRGSGDKR